MVKHNQKIRRKTAEELSVFDHFVGLTLKRLKDYGYKCLKHPRNRN